MVKKSDSPDEDKSVGDASALVPVLSDFFSLNPDFHPDTILGDSSFDFAEIHGKLFHYFHFSKTLIPYNPRNESTQLLQYATIIISAPHSGYLII